MMRNTILFLAALALAGCASPPAPRGDTPPVATPPSGVPEPARPEPPPAEAGAPEGEAPGRAAAVVALRQRAAEHLSAGELEGSAATLERALSIAPHDAALWLDLGWTRLAQGDPSQAALLAERARRSAATPELECEATRLARAADRRVRDVLRARAEAKSACDPRRG